MHKWVRFCPKLKQLRVIGHLGVNATQIQVLPLSWSYYLYETNVHHHEDLTDLSLRPYSLWETLPGGITTPEDLVSSSSENWTPDHIKVAVEEGVKTLIMIKKTSIFNIRWNLDPRLKLRKKVFLWTLFVTFCGNKPEKNWMILTRNGWAHLHTRRGGKGDGVGFLVSLQLSCLVLKVIRIIDILHIGPLISLWNGFQQKWKEFQLPFKIHLFFPFFFCNNHYQSMLNL